MQAVPLHSALERLDAIWDGLFDFSGHVVSHAGLLAGDVAMTCATRMLLLLYYSRARTCKGLP